MGWRARDGEDSGSVTYRVRSTGDGSGVDRPGVDVGRYGGTRVLEGEGR
jgi:hypothetical protein